VKLSVKSDYAARAVLALARQYPAGLAQRVEGIAVSQGIPANYLVQILIELKARRVVKSQRGKDGGYLLARPPAEITLGDILRCTYGQIFESPALTDPQCPPELARAWLRLQRAVTETADSITFQQLLEQSESPSRMYYI
jgi:Rrf2 family protein